MTFFYFLDYGTPSGNKVFIARLESSNPYYGPQPYPTRLFDGQYYRQRIYPFWQDTQNFYEVVFSAGDNTTPFSIVSQTNYYNGNPN